MSQKTKSQLQTVQDKLKANSKLLVRVLEDLDTPVAIHIDLNNVVKEVDTAIAYIERIKQYPVTSK